MHFPRIDGKETCAGYFALAFNKEAVQVSGQTGQFRSVENKETNKTMIAYDYEKQVWKHGRSGAEVRLSQLEGERELLTDPRRAEFLKFRGHENASEAQIAAALAVIERGIEECRFEIAQGEGRLAVIGDYLNTSTLGEAS